DQLKYSQRKLLRSGFTMRVMPLWSPLILNHQLAIINGLCPFQRAFAPGVVVTNDQNSDEDKHLDQGELRKRKIVAHEDDRPGQQKDCFDVEDEEEHGYDVITDRETIVRSGLGIDAAFVRSHLVFLIFPRTQKPADDQRQNWK